VSAPPLLTRKPGQCVLLTDNVVFRIDGDQPGLSLLLSNLYIRAASDTVNPRTDYSNMLDFGAVNGSLWLEDITFQGHHIGSGVGNFWRGIWIDANTTSLHATGALLHLWHRHTMTAL
jgi:hypothetical protein